MSIQFFTVKIKEIMTSPVASVSPDSYVKKAVELMVKSDIGVVVVLDEEGYSVGILSERDIISRVVAKGLDVETTRVEAVMTAHPLSLSMETQVSEAFLLMKERNFRHVPITSEDKVVGIISVKDINEVLNDTMSQVMGSALFDDDDDDDTDEE
jgi:signal-transduction protein with cAMP-binding, CBS, and nucleotidyltransferase domain